MTFKFLRLSCFLLLFIILFLSSQATEVRAASPAISGYAKSATNTPLENIWVRWTDTDTDGAETRYILTGPLDDPSHLYRPYDGSPPIRVHSDSGQFKFLAWDTPDGKQPAFNCDRTVDNAFTYNNASAGYFGTDSLTTSQRWNPWCKQDLDFADWRSAYLDWLATFSPGQTGDRLWAKVPYARNGLLYRPDNDTDDNNDSEITYVFNWFQYQNMTMIDSDKNGSFDTPKLSVDYSGGDNAFNCGSDPQSFTAIIPNAWYQSTTNSVVTGVNNSADNSIINLTITPKVLATISGPSSWTTGSTNPTFTLIPNTITSGSNTFSNIRRLEMLKSPTGTQTWTSAGYCDGNPVTWNCAVNGWTPPAAGNYYVVVNAGDQIISPASSCSGNPWLRYDNASTCTSGSTCCPAGSSCFSVANVNRCNASNGDFLTLTVSAPAPTINSLKVENASPTQTQFQGSYTSAGNTADKGGSNWLNPMKITAGITGGTGANKKYYVAFYDKKKNTSTIQSAYNTPASFLSDVQTLLHARPEAGWLLRYDDTTTPIYYVWDYSITTGGTDCTTNGCFVDLANFTLNGYTIRNAQSAPLYIAFPTTGSPASWQIRFFPEIKGKQMYTAVYAVSSAGSALEPDKDPIH